MALTDVYINKQPAYNVIQYTGENGDEVRQFLSDRGCTAYVASPEGTLNGTEGGSPYWVNAGSYIVVNINTNPGAIAGTPASLDNYELKA